MEGNHKDRQHGYVSHASGGNGSSFRHVMHHDGHHKPKPINLSVGQHVWVMDGKHQHAAVVKSLPSRHRFAKKQNGGVVTVKWDSTQNYSEIDLSLGTIMPMHQEDSQYGDEKIASSIFSKRIKMHDRPYSPPTFTTDGKWSSNLEVEGYKPKDDAGKMSKKTQHSTKTIQKFKIGDRIQAKYNGRGKTWYAGSIADMLPDDRCKVAYDDGDKDDNLSYRYIRLEIEEDIICSEDDAAGPWSVAGKLLVCIHFFQMMIHNT